MTRYTIISRIRQIQEYRNKAKILEARLKLAGTCGPDHAQEVGDWLREIAKLPEGDK